MPLQTDSLKTVIHVFKKTCITAPLRVTAQRHPKPCTANWSLSTAMSAPDLSLAPDSDWLQKRLSKWPAVPGSLLHVTTTYHALLTVAHPENTDSQHLQHFYQPYPSDLMQLWPASTLVNSPRNDSLDCIVPAVLSFWLVHPILRDNL